jgi:ABC-type transport system involved in cytochrome bd biosynthesis fused ATPase/permease subunit
MFVASVAPPAIIVVIFLVDPLSAVIAILTLPLIPVFGALIGKFTQDSVSRKWKSLGTLSRYFEDSLQGFVTLKIFGRHRTQGRRITEMGDQYTKETMAVLKISFLSAFVLELAATISVALIAVSIGLRLVDSKISFFHALVVLILAPEVYFPLRSAASLFHASVDGSEILSKIQELQNRFSAEVAQKERDFSATEKLSWERWTLTIPGVVESEIEAAEVHIGETVFIVGESGSGKSSFAENLLGQHFDADIRLDDRSLIPEHVDSYRSIVSWIPQLPHCAPGTIRDQFRVINPLITDSEIVDELLNVSLHLSDLPYGLDTLVGAREEKSSEISGGQLRKIAVARALLRNPRIIIADEPTADLDRESASAVMSALNVATSSGALLICITHDLDQVPRGSRVLHVVKAHP